MLVDSHCHLDFGVFDDDREDMIARAAQAGVGPGRPPHVAEFSVNKTTPKHPQKPIEPAGRSLWRAPNPCATSSMIKNPCSSKKANLSGVAPNADNLGRESAKAVAR